MKGEAKALPEKQVVTAFLEAEGEILLLRRSRRVGSYQGRWAGVSGYVEKVPDEQIMIEIAEETGLCRQDVRLLKKGEPLIVEDTSLGIHWRVHPYLFHVTDRSKIKIDWEHSESRWIKPADIAMYETVPNLKETLQRVYRGCPA